MSVMNLYKAKVELTVVMAVPDGERPTKEDVAEAVRNEISTNGLVCIDDQATVRILKISAMTDVPKVWKESIPWDTVRGLNPGEKRVCDILAESEKT